MRNFAVSVIPKDGEARVPVSLAGQIMIDIQRILGDIGEYLVAKELRIQKSLHPDLLNRFVLFMDENGGMSLGSSVIAPHTEGYGNVVDDALELMEATMDALGSGKGGYWMEDNYADPIYRNQIIYDVMALSRHLEFYSEFKLMYGSNNPKTFGCTDYNKLESFVRDKGFTANGATLGVITAVQSKSRGSILSLDCGGDRAKLIFFDKENEKTAHEFEGKAVLIGGKLSFTKEGALTEIKDAAGVTPVTEIRFRRMISGDGDVTLKESVVAKVDHSSNVWTLRNEALGISVSKSTWDEAVQSFHDYFIFLWTQYAGNNGEFSGEEAEVRDYLMSLV